MKSLDVSADTHPILTGYLLATRCRDVRTLKMRCLPQNVMAEVKFDLPHKSQLCGSARTDGDVLRYRDRHAPITPAWRRHAPISLHSTTSIFFVSGKPVDQPPPPPLPSHPKTFPSRLTLAAHHPISQHRHHRKATSSTNST